MIENPRHQHLNDTWGWIKSNPKQYDQRYWSRSAASGTKACVAGWGVLRAGGTLNYSRDADGVVQASTVVLASLPQDVQDDVARYRAGSWGAESETVGVSTAARFLFGLDDLDTANAMFAESNTMSDVEQMVTAVVTGAEFPFDLLDRDEPYDDGYDHDGMYDPYNPDDED